MKSFIRVRYVGKKSTHLGAHGELTPGSEVSMHYTDVQYLERSTDGWPEYLEKLPDSEHEVKQPKMLAILDDVSTLDFDDLQKVVEDEGLNIGEAMEEGVDVFRNAVRAVRNRKAQADALKEEKAKAEPKSDDSKSEPEPVENDGEADGEDAEADPDAEASGPVDGDAAPPVDPEPYVPPYEEWSFEDLKTEFEKRQADDPDAAALAIEGQPSKAKYAAALTAHDPEPGAE